MKKTVFCITILICFSSSVTFGLAPVGQPTSNLRKGWWSVGFDYSMSKIDLNAENNTTQSFFTEGSVDSLDIDLMLGKASLGIKNNWEVFVGLGTAETGGFSDTRTGQWGESIYTETDAFEFDGSSGYAAQIGTKYTFYEKSLIKAGVACQLTWLGLSGTLKEDIYKDDELMGTGQADVDSELFLFQLAPGISYQVAFGFSVYGGPLFQWVNGKAETKNKSGSLFKTKTDIDITSDSSIGGWIGLQADIDIFTSVNLEYQMTGSSSTIGINLTSKF